MKLAEPSKKATMAERNAAAEIDQKRTLGRSTSDVQWPLPAEHRRRILPPFFLLSVDLAAARTPTST
eukprot:scaffold12180_cov176-Skeletonema_menzelii.AAC.1